MEWIKCSDRLPPYDSTVVAWDEIEGGPVIFQTYNESVYRTSLATYLRDMKITHWMPAEKPTE
ncbi:DUF551 domain-containing protein [Cedecea sp.]|jgi:hypothetical protein|uniref:DUF551 domain-containing protein n=1 Tax=Cedecea sp. TaxID=1970739 RepID=UPI0039C89D76